MGLVGDGDLSNLEHSLYVIFLTLHLPNTNNVPLTFWVCENLRGPKLITPLWMDTQQAVKLFGALCALDDICKYRGKNVQLILNRSKTSARVYIAAA